MTRPLHRAYLDGPIPATFVRTALPIILLTSVNGLLTVADAALLGLFVGPDALAAVTCVFPLSMVLLALATMISSGAATLLGQRLGAGRPEEARRLLAGAHGLALVASGGAMLLFAAFGPWVTAMLAGGSPELARMGQTFLGLGVLTSPLALILAIQSDALRSEGRLGFMALCGLGVALGNLGFNALLIVGLGLGVAGSALGTALAQALALAIILAHRAGGRTQLGLSWGDRRHWRAGWGAVMALGAPRSLAFVGLALMAGATMTALHLLGGAEREHQIIAYGIITRITTFAYMPLLGMALALQAMVSTSHGAGLAARCRSILGFAALVALAYSVLVEAGLVLFRHPVSRGFVDDPSVAAEVARLLPYYLAVVVTLGPCVMVANYFQSIGEARRSTLLSISRTYLFAIPLTSVLPALLGERGLWLAQPVADALLTVVTLVVVLRAGLAGPFGPSWTRAAGAA